MNTIANEIPRRPKAIYLSHGGGPLPVLGDPDHLELVEHLETIAEAIRRPSAIVVVSAHWEEPVATITARPDPPIIYDYNGFPEESYSIEYPARGAPELAVNLHETLASHGIKSRLDRARGFDHGLYIPLLLMYPDADIPCVQLSLLANLDAAEHIRLGEALFGIEHEGLLVVGSGFSFHNLAAFFSSDKGAPDSGNLQFEKWLIDTCTNQLIGEEERTERLVRWDKAPGARHCHPREEHLLPMHVCYGFVKRASRAHKGLTIMKKKASTFFW